MRLDFYFDFISPYAFLAWTEIRDVAARHGADLHLHPVVFAALLSQGSTKGPAEIPAKRAFLVRDVMRIAARRGLSMGFPQPHPFRPITALRLALPGERQADRIDAIFRAGWQQGADLGDPASLAGALDAAGLDGEALVAGTKAPEAKAALHDSTAAAIERGVFGVPTMIAGDELIWGCDRIADLESVLDGSDPLDKARADAIIATPYGVRRPTEESPS